MVFLHGGAQFLTTRSLSLTDLFAWGSSVCNNKIFKFNSVLFAWGSSVCNNKIFKFNRSFCMGELFVTTRSLSLTVFFLHGGAQFVTFNNKIFNGDLFAWGSSVCNNRIFKHVYVIFLHGGSQTITTRSLSLMVIFLHWGSQFVTTGSVSLTGVHQYMIFLHERAQFVTTGSLTCVILLHEGALFVTTESLSLTGIFLHGGAQIITTRTLSLMVIFLHGGAQFVTFNNKIFKFNGELFARGSG